MTTRFATLCTLGVTHGYYDGPCRDFTFVVPDEAAALARRGRLLLKPRDGQLHVLFEAGADGKPITSMAGSVLRIALQLANALFVNVTALTFTPGRSVAVYGNGAAAQLAAPTIALPTGAILSHTLSRADRPATVALTNAASRVPDAITVEASPARASVSFDLDGFPSGLYTLTETYAGGVTQTASYYVDAQLAREPLFAVVELTITAAFYAAPAAFEISFSAREDTLRYYVVARHYPAAEFDQVAIADKGFDDDERPEIAFTKVAPAAFTASELPPSLLTADADDRLVLFRSATPVPRRAGGRRRIELSRNGTPLIANLPQAAADRPNADLVVHLSKPKP